MSDYGLRVINAANSCVTQDISLDHGTGILEHGLEQVIITMLLSKTTELSWKKYNEKYKDGLIQPDELIWPESSAHDTMDGEEV